MHTLHALNMAGQAGHCPSAWCRWSAAAVAGLAALLGYVTTKKAGTPFAMITLGIGELVWAMSLMFPEFFGGEGGINGNRVVGKAGLGHHLRPQIQLYYLIAAYCFVCTALMFAFTPHAAGRMLNAVRDNPSAWSSSATTRSSVRYLAFIIAAFFAGIAGGLGALNFRDRHGRSGRRRTPRAYLLFTFLGGAVFFFGPIIGAVLMVLAQVLLSELTKAWLLYLGLMFLFMVMYAPGGMASLIMMNLRVAASASCASLWTRTIWPGRHGVDRAAGGAAR